MHPEQRPGGDGDKRQEGRDPSTGAIVTDNESGVTVGTGSILGIGCLVAVIALVVIALAVRWLTGVW